MDRIYMGTLLMVQAILFTSIASAAFPEIPEIMADYSKPVAEEPPVGISRYDWLAEGQDELLVAMEMAKSRNWNVAKNVIIFIGDGMASTTTSAARAMKAQSDKQNGREALLEWEKFPYVGLARTANFERLTPDSASTATALLTGHKVRSTTTGVTHKAEREKCSTVEGNKAMSILKFSNAEGKRTGIVTTTRLTHATPQAAYAHMVNRDWEDNTYLPLDQLDVCKDSARQLIEENNYINVLFGGGSRHFLNDTMNDPTASSGKGRRTDGRDLFQEWQDTKAKTLAQDKYKYIWNKNQLNGIDTAKVDHVLGSFSSSHMSYEVDKDKAKEPTLTEMVEKAIQILDRGDKGYFLLVEGGRIDHAHHATNAFRALDETVALHKAVKKAVSMTDEKDTLILVTGDHSHSFAIQGYPTINNPIMGLSDSMSSYSKNNVGLDKKPYTTLAYTNGPGYSDHRFANSDGSTWRRKDLTSVDVKDKEFLQDALFPLKDETHGGEDVPIYARGPLSHLLTGSHEQNYVATLMMYASCVGPNKKHCSSDPAPQDGCNSGAIMRPSLAATVLLITTTSWLSKYLL